MRDQTQIERKEVRTGYKKKLFPHEDSQALERLPRQILQTQSLEVSKK